MEYKYGTISIEAYQNEVIKLRDAIFKLLPYRDESYDLLDKYFETVLLMMNGFNQLFCEPKGIVTAMCLVEAARKEESRSTYRKAILDATALVDSLKEDL